MNKRVYILIAYLVSCVAISAQQLTGSLDASGSWNFGQGHKENAAFKLNYDSTLYYVHVGISGKHDYTPTTEYTNTLNGDPTQSKLSLKTDTNQVRTRKWNIRADMDFGYHLTNQDLITLSAMYTHDNTRKEETLTSNRYLAETNPDLTIRMDTLIGNQNDKTLSLQHNIKVALGYRHQFSATSQLNLSFSSQQAFGSEGKQRELYGNMFAKSRNYTDANLLEESNYQLSLHYDDQQLGGVKNLKLKTGIDLLFDNDGDHYQADYNELGRPDTTILKFQRSYLSQYTEPFVNLQYRIGGWNFSVKERPQLYSNLQWEMLNVAAPQLLSRQTQFANLAEANIGYVLQVNHRFDLSYSYNVIRPNYKQFSIMTRLSNSEGEFIQGNDSLRPEQRHKLNFRYNYKPNKHIQTTLDVFYVHRRDKIEKVIIVDESANKEIKTLKTFTNANAQNQAGSTLRLKLNYEALEAEAWSGLAWEHFTYYSGAKPKDEISYQFGLMLNAHLNELVDLTSSMVYVSPTSSAYMEKNEYIGANLRLIYKSPVGVRLYIEANDLINKPRTETTWNESLTHMKVKEVIENRRCLSVGVSYVF